MEKNPLLARSSSKSRKAADSVRFQVAFMLGWKRLSGSTRSCLHQGDKSVFSTPLPSRGNRQFFAVGFPADCLRVLPAASSERKLAKASKKPSSGPSGFDFLYWGNGGYHSREAAFCIFSIPDDSDFSLRKNRGERHQERRRKTFFLAKSFSLCNLPQGDCKFTFQKCALRIGCFALCGGRPGLLALGLRCRFGRRLGCVPLAHGALARLSLDAIRV